MGLCSRTCASAHGLGSLRTKDERAADIGQISGSAICAMVPHLTALPTHGFIAWLYGCQAVHITVVHAEASTVHLACNESKHFSFADIAAA